MAFILYIIVLFFEVLYYSLFMKFTRKEGKFWKYLLTFVLETMIIFIFNSSSVITYFMFVITTLFFLKYLVRIKTSLYDMLFIFLMLFVKIIIETPVFILFNNLLDIYTIGIIYSILKTIILLLLKSKWNIIYNILKVKWDNNNFYIRYIFTIIMFLYIIISSIFVLLYYM